MCEEKEGVMRNAMTTRAPGGAKNNVHQNFTLSLEILNPHPLFRKYS